MKNIASIAENTRKNLIAANELFESDNLYGFCAKASAYLFSDLLVEGYYPNLHVAHLSDQYHVFLSVNSHIIDITASQFGEDNVVIQPMVNQALKPFWHMDYTCTNLNDLHVYLTSLNWAADQLFERP